MNIEYSRILWKRSTIPGTVPTIPTGSTIDNSWLSTDLLVGEGFLNTADDRFFFRTQNGIVEIPLSGVSSGGTYTVDAYLNGNEIVFDRNDILSAYTVDLTPLLTGSTADTYVTGGTYNSGTLTLERNDNVDVTITGFTDADNYTTGATLTNGVISFDRTDALSAYTVDISSIVPDLGTVLSIGNETDGNNIVISAGDKIIDNTSNNYIEFTKIRAAGGVLTTDSGSPSFGPTVTYDISPVSTSGGGTGLVVRMARNGIDNTFGISSRLINPGVGYQVGDTISFLGTQYGLSSPADDVTYTILSVTDEANNILMSSTDVESDSTSTQTLDASSYNITTANKDGYSSISGDAVSLSAVASDGNISTGLDLDPTGNKNGTKFYSEDYSNNVTSGLELDPAQNVNGTRLYTTDNNTSDSSSLIVGTSYSRLISSPGTMSKEDGLDLDPTGNKNGTKFYSQDFAAEQLSQVYVSPQSSGIQTLDSNNAVYNAGIATSFLPDDGLNNDLIKFGLFAQNSAGDGAATITGTVDLVTDESSIVLSADVIKIEATNAGTGLYFDDQINSIYTTVAFDSSGNLLLNSTDYVDTSEIRLEPTTINFTSAQVDFSNVTTIVGLPNDYTTGATLTNGVISFDRTDLLSAYTVDIKPALSNYLPLNVTGNTSVSVSDNTILTTSGVTNSQLFNYVRHGDSNDLFNGLIINKSNSAIFNQDSSSTDIFAASASALGGARLSYGDSGGTITSLFVNKSTASVESSIPTFNGLTYGADYSANYTNRSLVDKEYVDTAISGFSPTDYYVTGGTYSGTTLVLTRNDGNNVIVTGFTSGTSGTSGIDGTSGVNGTSGTSGTSGVNGTSGIDGTSGTSGVSGTSGTSGTSPTTAPYDISFAISDEVTAITTGTNKLTFYAPRAFTITKVVATLSASGSTLSEFDVNINGSTIFSRKPTIDANEFHSDDATAGQPILSTTSVSYKDKITIDIDQAGTGAKGAKIYIIGTITV